MILATLSLQIPLLQIPNLYRPKIHFNISFLTLLLAEGRSDKLGPFEAAFPV